MIKRGKFICTIIPKGNWMGRDKLKFECDKDPEESAKLAIRGILKINPDNVDYEVLSTEVSCLQPVP